MGKEGGKGAIASHWVGKEGEGEGKAEERL